MEVINTIGRRKSSVARIYMTDGKGKIVVNNKDLKDYFVTSEAQYAVNVPLVTCGVEGKYDIKINVDGGGITGQSDAVKLAISRALVKIDEETYKPMLKAKGLLTRDPRMVERKKYGQPKARKKTQFSKR